MAAEPVQKGLTPKPLSIWTCRAAPTKAERHAISAISLCFLTHLYGSRSSLLPLAANFFPRQTILLFLLKMRVFIFQNTF